jgi:hypothetical protein
VAFPDDGAAKRFAHMFKPLKMEIVICGKVGPPWQGQTPMVQKAWTTLRDCHTLGSSWPGGTGLMHQVPRPSRGFSQRGLIYDLYFYIYDL